MSTQHDRLDPESRSALEVFLGALPGGFNGIPDIVARLEASAALNAAGVEAAGGPDPSVTRDDRTVPGLDGDPEVPVRVYRPVDAPADAKLPGIFFIHGGGMIMGSVEGEDGMATAYAREVGVWDRAGNIEAWEWFLGGGEPDKYASPLLETDWSGLAPIFIDVGTEDMFRDEDITLVGELVRQGNPVEFHLYPGAFHASEVLAPEASLSKRIMANRLDAVKRAVAAG